jgi:hypothetical protein
VVANRFVPVKVTGTVKLPEFGRKADAGEIDVSAGAVEAATVNVTVPVVPPGFVMLTLCDPSVVEFESIANVVTTVVGDTLAIVPTVTPLPSTVTDVFAVVAPFAFKFVPVKVTDRLAVPSAPVVGLMEVSFGALGLITVNATGPELPFGVVTLTLCIPTVLSKPSIRNDAVTVVAVGVLVMVAVTPVPSTFTVVAPVKLLPARVTAGLEVFRLPVAGEMEVKEGVGPVTVKMTKPEVPFDVVTLTL